MKTEKIGICSKCERSDCTDCYYYNEPNSASLTPKQDDFIHLEGER